MSLTRLGLLGLALSVSAVVVAASGEEATPSDSTFRNEADVALTEWALKRFDEEGLHLPRVALHFHDEKAPCQGQNGYFHPGDPHQIEICGFNWNRFLVTPKKVMLHELAHAWTHENMDEESRQRFLEMRGLEHWNESGAAWGDKGMEHAAEVIAWSLMDEEISLTSIGSPDPVVIIEAYELLTSS